MKALRFTELAKLAVEDIPASEPASGEVLIRVARTGMCHTDLDVLHGHYPASYPITPGHEMAGTIIGVGLGVNAGRVGERVAVDPLLPCGECLPCRRGRRSLCERLGVYGITYNGGFAPLVVVRSENAHPVGDMPFSRAALAEPFACVLHGLSRAHAPDCTRALVVGAGPIGLLMLNGLLYRGAPEVDVVDIDPDRLLRARRMGAHQTFSGTAQVLDSARQGYDLVIDATGVADVVSQLPNLVRSGGTLLLFGVCRPEVTVAFSPHEIFLRELTVLGSHSLNGELPQAIKALQDRGAVLDELISHVVNAQGLADLMASSDLRGRLKVQYAADTIEVRGQISPLLIGNEKPVRL